MTHPYNHPLSGREMFRVECETCGWFNQSWDESWTRNAGRVHREVLKVGHVVIEKGWGFHE